MMIPVPAGTPADCTVPQVAVQVGIPGMCSHGLDSLVPELLSDAPESDEA